MDGINGDKGQVLECLEVYSKEASHRARKEKHGSVLNLLENALADYSANQGTFLLHSLLTLSYCVLSVTLTADTLILCTFCYTHC